MYKTLDAPLSAHLEVTTSCNQRCQHCYNFWRPNDPHLVLSSSFGLHVIEELSANGVFHVILNGGEPLLNVDMLVLLMEALRRHNISFSLNSNLTRLNRNDAERMKQAGLRTVLTSLLSSDQTTHDYLSGKQGSFARVVNGIKTAREAGLCIAINMVVSKPNLRHVESTGRFAATLGAFAFSATRAILPRISDGAMKTLLLDREEARMLLDAMKKLQNARISLDSLVPYPTCFFGAEHEYKLFGKRTCSAGKTSVAISCDGIVRTCPHHEVGYGSLRNEGLSSIWLKMQAWRDGSLLPPECLRCRLLPRCGGGCRVSGSIHATDRADPLMQEDCVTEIRTSVAERCIKSDVETETVMRIRQSCRLRKDAVIGIINTGGIKNTFVDLPTYDVIASLHRDSVVFTPESLRRSFGINMKNQRYFRFLSGLVQREIAEIVDG